MHTHANTKGRALKGAALLTLGFMAVEIGVGLWTGSLSLFSDGLHMALDSGALLLSLAAFWISQKPSTPMMSFGYHRAEVVGALISAVLIWALSAFLLFRAFGRLSAPVEVNAGPATIVAALGLLINILSLKLLHPESGDNLNIRAAYLHVASDMLGSIGAVISGLVILWTGWYAIDTYVALMIVTLLIASSWRLMKESVAILMNSAPPHIDPSSIRAELAKIPGVQGVHDLHIWSVYQNRHALSVHLISDSPGPVLTAAQSLLAQQFEITHTTIQIENPAHFDVSRCFDCAQSGDLLGSDHSHGTHP